MKQQRGGTILGFIIGVVVGLAIALGVAVYVTKVPIPFMNKGQSRSAEQDEAEARKNKDWDPNAPLYGKNPAKTSSTVVTPGVPVAPASAASAAKAEPKASGKDVAKAEPKGENKADAKPDPKPAVSADPLGDLAKAENLNPTYISRLVRLALLAPDIVEAIMVGLQPAHLTMKDLMGPFPAEWAKQRARFYPGSGAL